MMASLPWFRVQPHLPPFAHTGVDLFGPFEVTIFRRKVKRWGILFTCLNSRAVHLDMTYTLETDSFICALDRFRHSRGTPANLYSDNGTNLVGAHNELREGIARLDQAKITSSLANKGIQWQFITPATPHHGGAWERLVRSAKQALRFVLNQQTLTDEIFITTLKLAESLLNSRPLTYISTDPEDPEPLTPNHILLGRANPFIPPDIIGTDDLSSKKRWRVSQAIAQHFWRRWMGELLPTLVQRPKWFQPQRNLKENDVVIFIKKNNPMGKWPLALVLKVYPDPDGTVRSALIRTGGMELHRSSVDLCLLEPDPEDASAPVGRRAGDVPDAPSSSQTGLPSTPQKE